MPDFNKLSDDKENRLALLSFPLDLLRKAQELSWRSLSQSSLTENAFYQQKFVDIDHASMTLDKFDQLPFTTKSELMGDGDSEFAANLTHSPDSYTRFHRTSGTRGRPMIVLDTTEDWEHWIEAWQYVLDAADVGPEDRAVMAFSFGPFVGFWSAFDAAIERGALVLPTGSLSTAARLELIQTSGATVVFCTPSYALHLAQVAKEKSLPLSESNVRAIVVAGEPGGSVPEIRRQIESAWQAKVIDHAGATEVGPWGFADSEGSGLFVNESQFYPEFLAVDSGELLESNSPQTEGVVCQLVLTTIGRLGCWAALIIC